MRPKKFRADVSFCPIKTYGGNYQVKKTIVFVGLCALLAVCVPSVMAQAPSFLKTTSSNGVPGVQPFAPTLPTYCRPCLFYGGDWPSADSNWVIFANADGAGFGGQVSIYSSFVVPAGQTYTVTGLFSSNGFINIDHFTPSTPEWTINSGMHAGSAGTVIASGKTFGKAVATGRSASSGAGNVTEYAVTTRLPTPAVLTSGLYFEGVTPPCDSTKDSACSGALYYETDSYDPANTNNEGVNHFGAKAKTGGNFQNGSVFGLNYVPVNASYCSQYGYQPYACSFMSAGVLGTR
jgi:hypothetical protein